MDGALNKIYMAKVLFEAAYGDSVPYVSEEYQERTLFAYTCLDELSREIVDRHYGYGLPLFDVGCLLKSKLGNISVETQLGIILRAVQSYTTTQFLTLDLPMRLIRRLYTLQVITVEAILNTAYASICRKSNVGLSFMDMLTLVACMEKAGYTDWTSERKLELDSLVSERKDVLDVKVSSKAVFAVAQSREVYKRVYDYTVLTDAELAVYAFRVYKAMYKENNPMYVHVQGVLDLIMQAEKTGLLTTQTHNFLFKYYACGLTYGDISVEFGVTRQAACAGVSRALENLRKYAKLVYTDCGGEPYLDLVKSNLVDMCQISDELKRQASKTQAYKQELDEAVALVMDLTTKLKQLSSVCKAYGLNICDSTDLSSVKYTTSMFPSLCVNDLGFTVRLERCLLMSQINTVKDILDVDFKKLISIPTFGVGCLKELIAYMASMGCGAWVLNVKEGIRTSTYARQMADYI